MDVLRPAICTAALVSGWQMGSGVSLLNRSQPQGIKAAAEGVLLKEREMSHIGKLPSELQCVCSAIY